MANSEGIKDPQKSLSRDLILEKTSIYAEEYPEEKELFDEISEKINRGDWEWNDLERIVYWKSQRASSYFEENDQRMVNEIVKQVINTDDITKKVELLQSIKGIQVPMSSAFLMFIDPTKYTVIDVRAWNTLQKMEYLTSDLSSTPSVEEYLLYLGTCRALATEYEVSLRDLDRTLWILDTEL